MRSNPPHHPCHHISALLRKPYKPESPLHLSGSRVVICTVSGELEEGGGQGEFWDGSRDGDGIWDGDGWWGGYSYRVNVHRIYKIAVREEEDEEMGTMTFETTLAALCFIPLPPPQPRRGKELNNPRIK